MGGLVEFYDAVVVGILLILLLNAGLNAFFFPSVKRRKVKRARDDEQPKVSILVPARNEAHQIAHLLDSLRAQTYKNLEVLVLDDCSEDATARVVKDLGFSETGARRLIRGEPLPRGWTGKPWACHQLSQQATGDFLLFTDADTVHHEMSVESAVAMALRRQTHLLSVWPHQITISWSEKLVIPMVYLLALAFIPLWFVEIAQRSPAKFKWVPQRFWERCGVANGQFMLFTRDAYKQLGGHQSVKNHLVEDVAFGHAVTKRLPDGWRILNADGHDIVECRMYHKFLEVWEGFSKNLRPVFEKRGWQFIAVGVILAATMVLPFIWILALEHLWLVALQTQLVLLIRIIPTIRFRTSWWSVLLHPFSIVLSMGIALNSWMISRTGKITWKSRQYAWSSRSGEAEKIGDVD